MVLLFNGGSMNSTTRGIIQRSDTPSSPVGVLDTIIMRSAGNATDFGDIFGSYTEAHGGVCNATRGILAGGYLNNFISYITMATLGDAKDFGDLISNVNSAKAASSKTQVLLLGDIMEQQV